MTSILLATATAAKSGSTVTAVINGTTTTIQAARDLTIAAGDVLVVVKAGATNKWVAIARCFTAAPGAVDPAPPPPPKPTVVNGTLVVPAVYTGSYRGGKWRTDTTDVIQGQYGGAYGNSTGAAFYGSKPRSLAGATVTDASIRVSRATGGAYASQATTLRLITQSTKPSGAPTLTSSTSGPSIRVGTSASFDVPTSWAQSIVDGTAGGIGLFDSSGSPYVRFTGRGDSSSAFALTIKYRR